MVKGFLERVIPIADVFYDDKKDEDLIASKTVLLPFNAVLMISQWLGFVALLWYYSGPEAHVKTTTIQMDYNWSAPAFNCTPMMKDIYYGQQIGYDLCLREAASRPPGSTTIKNYDSAEGPWEYIPFSFNAKSATFPQHNEVVHGDIDKAAAADDVFIAKVKAVQGCSDDVTTFYDGNDLADEVWSIPKIPGYKWTERTAAVVATQGGGCQDYGDADWHDIYQDDSCYYKWDQDLYDMLANDDLANVETFRDEYERGYVLTACTTLTPEKAKEIFQVAYDDDMFCGFTQIAVPFSCEKSAPPSLPQRFSLAYANSLLLYTVFSAICVRVFFASAGKKEVSAPEERSAKVSPA